MSLLRINHQPSSRQLRTFAVAWLVFFGTFAGACALRGRHSAAIALGVLALVVPLVGLVSSSFLRIAFLGLSYATFPIGWLMSHIVLAVVYYLAVTPIAWILRLFHYDPLKRRIHRTAGTYWTDVTPSPVERYFRQH